MPRISNIGDASISKNFSNTTLNNHKGSDQGGEQFTVSGTPKQQQLQTISDKNAIQPYIEAGINPLKIQICLRFILVFPVNKGMDILSTWIFIWDVRRVHGKRITHIRILMTVISIILPYSRNIYQTKS